MTHISEISTADHAGFSHNFSDWILELATRFSRRTGTTGHGGSSPSNNHLRRDVGLAERAVAENPYRHWPSL